MSRPMDWRNGDCACDGESKCTSHRFIVGWWQVRLSSVEYDQHKDYWKDIHATHREDAEFRALRDEPEDAKVCEVIPPPEHEYEDVA